MNIKAVSKNGSLQAAQAIGASIKTLLGPSCSVKCCVDDDNDAIICSSAVKILQYLDHKVQHPAWFVIHDACEAFYKIYGCGCKTLVCMIGFWSREAAILQHEGVPVPVIIQLFQEALTECIKVLEEIAVPLQNVKEHNIFKSLDFTLDSKPLAKTYNMANTYESQTCDHENEMLRGVDSVMDSLSLNAEYNQSGRSLMMVHEADRSLNMQGKNHELQSGQHDGMVEQMRHEDEMKDEFDDCFDFPDDQSSNSHFVANSQPRPSSCHSQTSAASSKRSLNISKQLSLNKLELNKTEELLKNLSLSGLKGSKPKRNYSQFVIGCRNLQPDNSIKTIIESRNLNFKTGTSYPRTSTFMHDSFNLTNKEDLKMLGKMLSHGKEKEMALAIEVIYAQIKIEKSNLGKFEVDKNCINVETIVGPSSDSAQVIDGIVVQANSSLLLVLPEGQVNVALVNGDVTEDFKHAGFKDSFNARQVVGKPFPDELHLREGKSWLGNVKEVLNRFNIGVLFVRGNIDKDLQEFCQARKVVTISSTSPKILHLLSTTLGATIVVYLTDLKQSDIGKPVNIHHWVMPGRNTVDASFIVVKSCVENNLPAHTTPHEVCDRVEHDYNALMQTVLLCAPSEHLLMASELAFWNCVSLLRNTVNQGCVLPGAGHTELACIKRLSSLADKSASQNPTPAKSSNWLKASLHSYRQAVYAAFCDGLTEFVTNVLLNTGQFVHHGQAITKVHEVLEGKYQDLLHCTYEGNTEPSILSVADDCVAKLNAWRRAVGVVCVLIQSDMIVQTGIDKGNTDHH